MESESKQKFMYFDAIAAPSNIRAGFWAEIKFSLSSFCVNNFNGYLTCFVCHEIVTKLDFDLKCIHVSQRLPNC